MTETIDIEQQIATAWASVELAKMSLDDARTSAEKDYWSQEVMRRQVRWTQLIDELDRLHGGQGLAHIHLYYAALIAGIVLAMMACLGVVWSVMQ